MALLLKSQSLKSDLSLRFDSTASSARYSTSLCLFSPIENRHELIGLQGKLYKIMPIKSLANKSFMLAIILD